MLLAGNAGLQRYRAYAEDRSSWSGAGFGMFATLNQERLGFVLAEATSPKGKVRIAAPQELDRDLIELRADPRPARLEEVARRWLAIVRKDDSTVTELYAALYHVDFDTRRSGPTLRPRLQQEVTVR